MKPRETRHGVSLPARLRWQGHWLSASVHNISAHGLLLTLPEPPKPGTYVEIYLGAAHVVARSIWTAGQFCGLRSRETFDLSGILGNRGPGRIALANRAPAQAPARRRPSVSEPEEASRRMASLFQYATFTLVAVTAASTIAWEVYKTLSAPMDAIHGALDE